MQWFMSVFMWLIVELKGSLLSVNCRISAIGVLKKMQQLPARHKADIAP